MTASLATPPASKTSVAAISILASGSKVTSTSIAGTMDETVLTWQSTDQKLDGKALPDTKEVKMKRIR